LPCFEPETERQTPAIPSITPGCLLVVETFMPLFQCLDCSPLWYHPPHMVVNPEHHLPIEIVMCV
jgi:hypothetical protein